MSASMEDSAVQSASFTGQFRKQVCTRVPKIPAHVSLQGKTAIITGASGGLGLECARQFLQVGASKLILAVRTLAKGNSAAEQLWKEYPKADIEVWILEMESYDSVRDFASRCNTLERLDVVILNAGCGRQNFKRCGGEKGREVTLQVNYLATFLLAALLVPVLRAKRSSQSPGRMTIVSSDLAFMAVLKERNGSLLEDLDSEDGFHGFAQYAKSKLLVAMFVPKLAEHVDANDVVINALNPSGVRGTELMRDSKGHYATQALVGIQMALMGRNLVDGTRQYLHSALVLGKDSHGSYTDFEIRPYPPMMYTKYGIEQSNKLWDETLEELGINDIDALLNP